MKNSWNKIVSIVGLFICLTSSVFGANKGVLNSIEKWEVLDIALTAKVEAANPFIVDANADFIHKRTGKKLTVPIFYNGDDQWLIRFSANEQGTWQYATQSAEASLNGLTGSVSVTQNDDASNHGAIVLSETDKQNFYYEDGTPYFLQGYEIDWLYALDYHNDRALPKSDHLLSLIKEHGFNHVVMNIFSYDVSWTKDPKLADHPEHEFGGPDDIYPFLGNNDNPDHSALNVEFFQKFDRTIQLMHDKRIAAHLMIYVWNKLVSWPDMDSVADNMYFDYVVKRYQAYPNVVWDISKEALYYGRADEAYIKGRIDRLQALNTYERLVTVHDYGYCAKYPEQVDFISTQDWGFDIYNRMLNARKRFPNKPVYNIEHGGYEESPYLVFPGDYTSPEVSVHRNWMTLFAGVYTTYYWQAHAWNVIIYNPFEQPEGVIKPRLDYFKHISHLFTLFPYADFTPAPHKNGSGFTLINDEETYLVYVSKDNYQMSRGHWFLGPKDGVVRNIYWFNTLTGEMTEPKTFGNNHRVISPWRGKQDAILISEIVKK